MSFFFEWRITEKIRPLILKELEKLELIEKIDRKRIKINKSQFDIKDLRVFYINLGII